MIVTNDKSSEWSLRALASMRAVHLFLRARAVIQYILRSASTLENTDGEQRALGKFSGWDLDLSLLHCEKKRLAQSIKSG